MSSNMKSYIEVNGIDVSATIKKWKTIESAFQEIRDMELHARTTMNTLVSDLRPGMQVIVKRGRTTSQDQWVFKGIIDTYIKDKGGVIIRAKDEMVKLVNRNVNYIYNGVAFPASEAKGSDIATNLIEEWGGMTATVVDTGDEVTFKKFICRNKDIFGQLQQLCSIYDYACYYDPDDDTVHFEPKGYNDNLRPLVVGTNVRNNPKWERDTTRMVNKLTVKGAVQEVQEEEYFSGDGLANQEFVLQKKPLVVQAWENVAGTWTLKVPGVEGSTSTAYDFDTDKEEKIITTTDDWTPAIGADNVKIVYTTALPVPVTVDDEVSQTLYDIHESEKIFEDIQTVADAEERGASYLAKYSIPFFRTELHVLGEVDYEAGQQVLVTDNANNESHNMVISEITKEFPHKYDIIKVGDEDWRTSDWGVLTIDRVRRLEERNQKDSELMVYIKFFKQSVTFKRRYTKVSTRTITGEGFIIGHKTMGVIGTSKLGDPLGSEEVQRIVWPDEKYIERFKDTDFSDVGTGTWNTTLNRLEL